MLRHNHERLLRDCRTPGFLECIPNWVCIEGLYHLTQFEAPSTSSGLMVALEIESFLESQSQQSIGTTLGLLQSYRRKRLWHKIMRLEAKLVGNPLFEHQDVLLCRFECLCSALKMEEAKEFYYRYYSNRQLRQWETCVVLRFWRKPKCGLKQKFCFLTSSRTGTVCQMAMPFC